MELRNEEAHRRQAIRFARTLTAGTSLEPQWYERELLERYARGQLTLDQAQAQLAGQVHYILYYSRAAPCFSAEHLPPLLEQARRYNKQHGITGLLCYSHGHFVQLLEGPAREVRARYASIRHEADPYQVLCLRDGAGPTRHFANSYMASAHVAPLAFEWLLTRLDAQGPASPADPEVLLEPPVHTLLTAFGQP